MNPYSIPPLISAIVLLGLSLISILYGRRVKINIVFAMFTLALSLSALTAFIFYETNNLDTASQWAKIPFVIAIPAPLLALYYALVVSGYIEYLDEKRRGISLRFYIYFLFVYGGIIAIFTFFTDWIITGVETHQLAAYELTYGSLFLPAAAGLSLITITVIVLFYKAYRQSTDLPKRVKLLYNLIGFAILYFPAGVMRIYLPYFDIQTHSLAFVPFTLAAFIFYLAILRFQFSQIDELNRNLEKRVEERTSQLRETQAQLLQSKKMAALGDLVAGIAHEINNPLAVILGNQDILKRAIHKLNMQIPGEAISANASLKTMQTIGNLSGGNKMAAERIAGIIRSLKRFARLDEAEVVRANLNQGLEDTLILLKHRSNNRIRLVREYGDIPEIYCQANQLNQAFMNILLNAIEAIDGKGEIRIATGQTADVVWIKISDSGRGISPEHVERIFEPGFTTKGVGVGTGLGLSISYQIIRQHQGKLSVKSEIGQGSTFIIEIPKELKYETENSRKNFEIRC